MTISGDAILKNKVSSLKWRCCLIFQDRISNGDGSLFFRITSLGDERKTRYHLHGDGDADSLPPSPWRCYPFFKLASLGDGEAFFKDSSLEMDTWFSSHHLWRLSRDGAAFFKLASLGDGNVVLEQSSLAPLQRW